MTQLPSDNLSTALDAFVHAQRDYDSSFVLRPDVTAADVSARRARLDQARRLVIEIQASNVQSQAAKIIIGYVTDPATVRAVAEQSTDVQISNPALLGQLAHAVALTLADMEAQAITEARAAVVRQQEAQDG